MLNSQSAYYIFRHRYGILSFFLPSTSLRPLAKIQCHQVGSNHVTRFNHDHGNQRNTGHLSLKYGHVDYTICTQNFIRERREREGSLYVVVRPSVVCL